MQISRSKLQNAKLSPTEIPGIRRRVLSHQSTTAQEADRFGVGVETIRRAVRGETFRNVKSGLPAEPDALPTLPDIPAETILESVKRLEGLIDTNDTSPVDDFLRARKETK